MIEEIAHRNFEQHIRQNSYPGRGIVIGRSEAAEWVIVYWIMGRSPNSRNRCFVLDDTTLRTEALDPRVVENPDLIIYEVMLELPGVFLVSNGDQTRTLFETIQRGGSFDAALLTREREPDAPNYTPRISGMVMPGNEVNPVTMSILKANTADPAQTDRFTYRLAPPLPGIGYCLTTYMGDGRPLPSFAGDPILLPCKGSQEVICDSYWEGLDDANKVALAVKIIHKSGSETIVRNKGVLQ